MSTNSDTYTGNGATVVAALRHRGYTADKLRAAGYEITACPSAETERGEAG